VACHGGHGDETDEAGAHVGLLRPLAETDEQCGLCHGASTPSFLARYRARGPAPDAGGDRPARGGADSSTRPPSASPTRATSRHGDVGRNVAMTLVVVLFGAAAALYVLRSERAAARAAEGPVA